MSTECIWPLSYTGSNQWAPLVLTLHALRFCLPLLFWLAMQQRSGTGLHAVMDAVKRVAFAPDADERNEHLESLDKKPLTPHGYRSTCYDEERRCVNETALCAPCKRRCIPATCSLSTFWRTSARSCCCPSRRASSWLT